MVPAVFAAKPAAADTYYLEINGSPAMKFRATCLVAQGGETGRARMKGLVPKTYWVDADGLNCIVQKFDARGRLEVLLRRADEAIAYKETAAAYNWVRVQSDGPWGRAGALRGNQPTIIQPGH